MANLKGLLGSPSQFFLLSFCLVIWSNYKSTSFHRCRFLDCFRVHLNTSYQIIPKIVKEKNENCDGKQTDDETKELAFTDFGF